MKALSVWLILALFLFGCNAGSPTETPVADSDPTPITTTTEPTRGVSPVPTHTGTTVPTRVQTLGINAVDLRGVKVSFWFSAVGELSKEILAQVAEFNRSNIWGITVQGRAFADAGQLEEQVLAAHKTGGLPQAAAAPLELLISWNTNMQLVAPLDRYIQDAAWGLTQKEVADFPQPLWKAGQVGGVRWTIPAERNLQVIFYNQGWAEELGFHSPPATPLDFRAQACAAMKANVADDRPENDGTGGWIAVNDALAVASWLRAFGSQPAPDEEGQLYHFNTPSSLKAFSFLRKLLDDNCAWNARNPAPYPYLAQRQALFYSGSLLDLPYQAKAMDFAKSKDRWSVMPYPPETQPPVVLESGTSLAVLLSRPVEQLAAWLFLRYLILPRVEARLASTGGLLPARSSALAEMEDYRRDHPQWAAASGWQDWLQPAPRLASWRQARRVLEDASWQIFSPITRVDGISAVLAELDETVSELVLKK